MKKLISLGMGLAFALSVSLVPAMAAEDVSIASDKPVVEELALTPMTDTELDATTAAGSCLGCANVANNASLLGQANQNFGSGGALSGNALQVNAAAVIQANLQAIVNIF